MEDEPFHKISGVLRFKGKPIITPVIESLFAHVNEDYFTVSEDNTISIIYTELVDYSCIASHFNENVMKFDLSPGDNKTMADWVHYLCKKFNVNTHDIFEGEVEDINYCDGKLVDLNDLFYFAKRFNDGHNLYSIEIGAASLENDSFYGEATYTSDLVEYNRSTESILNDLVMFDSHIANHRLVAANEILKRQMLEFTAKIPHSIKSQLMNVILDDLIEHLPDITMERIKEKILLDERNAALQDTSKSTFSTRPKF